MNLLMRRFPTILGLLLAVGVVVAAIYFWQSMTPKITDEMRPKNIRITNIADNKFSVSWTTASPTLGQVEYGRVGEKLALVARDERDTSANQVPRNTHHVTIEGLQPSTQYAFRVMTGEDKLVRFDNNGSPYTVSTGPVIGSTPSSSNFYGNVELPTGQPAEGSIVYLTLPGAGTASTLVYESGDYAITLSTIRTSDLRSYASFDPLATVASLSIVGPKSQSNSSVSLANAEPVPTITLGESVDFLSKPSEVVVAEVEETVSTESEAPSIFNVEPLSGAEINVVGTSTTTITNPREEGEILKTLRPEFRGTGTAGSTISISITGQKSVSDTVAVASDGTWSFAPVIDLKTGAQTITVSYTGSGGTPLTTSRGFVITTGTSSDPAFVASPSASKAPTSTASASPSSTPRAAMPSTDSGVPVTGVIENTLLTAGLGIVMMIVAAVLLVL